MKVPYDRSEPPAGAGGAPEPGLAELGRDGPSTVIVGVDGTPSSMRAAAYAVGVARRQGATLIAVFVEPFAEPGQAAAAGAALTPPMTDVKRQLEDEVRRQLAGDAEAWGARLELQVREGDPAAELVAAADETKADLLVVGASSGVLHRLAGSIPSRLIRHRRWVLTVVP